MMRSMLFLAILVGASACDQLAAPVRKSPLPPVAAPNIPRPLTASGAPVTLSPAAANRQEAASVTEVVVLRGQGDTTIKLFGLAGGDPAMNGLHTYLAVFIDPAQGWRVFQIGDFLSFRVVASSPGRVDLEVRESTHNPDTGVIGQATRRMIVGFARGPQGEPPATITVTPAR
ncbi:MAG: hypothetical protein EON91_01055 [Brevundimonas sp.]|uniref:hypothetical protein n=1 Tax=Brevundimonas sp. TaxID=1871086 RepID=UPI001202081D|nr:hypothetical protein [Brevundimonas sp.]RZJ19474.1 MAG: hypothetical protein EON91_01055 [Brevundimonas sp.]